MGLVRGEDVVLSISQFNGVENVFIPIGCARSVTFDISTDFIETSVTESGAFKTFIPSGKQFSGNIEGLAFINRPALSETRATTIIDYTDLADAGLFPCLGATALINVIDPPGSSLSICNIGSASYASLADFISAINTAINASIQGYTSTIVGTTIVITARPGVGATINGNACYSSYDIDATVPPAPGYITDNFSGGVDAYYPDKLGIGWMYDKIVSGERFLLNYYETDSDNNELQKYGYVYIESINETSSFDNLVTFTASFKGDGVPTFNYGEI